MKTLLTLILLSQVGCASVSQVTVKDGKPLYQAKCRTSTADCHKLASEKCGGNYDVLESTVHIVDHYLMFVCKL